MSTTPPSSPSPYPVSGPWWREMTRYHWFVFTVAALGWLADCMDQQLFNLARVSAVTELVNKEFTADQRAEPETKKFIEGRIKEWAGYSTAIFLIGWATGGIFFGILGDRWGRVKTMLVTILLYSLFTGLSALSVGVWDFAFYRFLTGLGVGGEFAVGVALLAETMPARARPNTLGMLQAFSAVGNLMAAGLFMLMGWLEMQGVFLNSTYTSWRWLFLIGTVPALIALLVRRRLDEPETWKQMAQSETGRTAGSYSQLLGQQPWRKHALAGLALAFAGVVGLWGIGFFAVDLQQYVMRGYLDGQTTGWEAHQKMGYNKIWAGISSAMINIGAFFGMFGFTLLTAFTGRRPAFAVFFVLAALSTAMVFMYMNTVADVLWMLPVMGFCQLALFGGYAIYFPELFPTQLRSTGTSFCYNVGRFVAAVGPAALGLLTTQVFADFKTEADPVMPFRYAGLTMCSVFGIGLIALLFLPETKGKPLPV